MKNIHLWLLACILACFATPAFAQATRTWVSGVGDDVNPCSRTAPCKTFAGAISKTATAGEINCLDPGGFGGVVITKSITIDCGGTFGSVLAANQNGITINAASIVVVLRNLTINGAGTLVGNGVRIVNAAEVHIENVVLENFGGSNTNGRGVAIETASNVSVTIQSSRFTNNGFMGIHSNPSAGMVNLAVNNTEIAGSGTGLQFRQNTQAAINNVTVLNSNAGLASELGSVSAIISNSNFSNNAFGIINGNGGAPTMRIYGTVITGNTTNGLQISAGQVISLGNNLFRGNAGNEAPSSTIGTQ